MVTEKTNLWKDMICLYIIIEFYILIIFIQILSQNLKYMYLFH